MKHVVLASAVLLSLSTLCVAQIRPTPHQDTTTIHGTFSTWKLGNNCSVELRVDGRADAIATELCNQSGFEFENVPRGEYLLVVRQGLDQVTQRVSAEDFEVNVMVDVPQSRSDTQSGQATVSLNELKIPDKAKNLVVKANNELAHANLDAAEKYAQKALKVAPAYAMAISLDAAIRMAKNDSSGAMAEADRAVQADPQLAYAQFVRAAILNRMQKFSDAKQAAEQGLRTDAQSWQGHFELAQALNGMNDAKAALTELTTAERRAPQGFAPIHVLKVLLLIQTDNLAAAKNELALLDKCKTILPQSAALHHLLAQAATKITQPKLP